MAGVGIRDQCRLSRKSAAHDSCASWQGRQPTSSAECSRYVAYRARGKWPPARVFRNPASHGPRSRSTCWAGNHLPRHAAGDGEFQRNEAPEAPRYSVRSVASLEGSASDVPRDAVAGGSRLVEGTRGEYQTVRSEEHTSELQSLRHLVC